MLFDDRTARDYRIGSVARMLIAGPFDLFLYRPLIMIARLYGTWGYLCGRRDWDKFERNPRRPRLSLRPTDPVGRLPG